MVTQVATVCAWCAREQGQTPREGQSHGICTNHRNKEREKYQASRPVHPLSVEAIGTHTQHISAVMPIYGTCGHLAKSPQYSCGSPNCSQYSW